MALQNFRLSNIHYQKQKWILMQDSIKLQMLKLILWSQKEIVIYDSVSRFFGVLYFYLFFIYWCLQ